jgi:hypothetical protein
MQRTRRSARRQERSVHTQLGLQVGPDVLGGGLRRYEHAGRAGRWWRGSRRVQWRRLTRSRRSMSR